MISFRFVLHYFVYMADKNGVNDKNGSVFSYDSIFKYTSSGDLSRRNNHHGHVQYWHPESVRIDSDYQQNNDNDLRAFLRLLVNPPFATSNEYERLGSSSSSAVSTYNPGSTAISAIQTTAWSMAMIMFASFWILFFPFHFYWTLFKVKEKEAVVVFRAGQRPSVRTKPGSLVCSWPLFDRKHRVSLERRGFSVPPGQMGLQDGAVVRIGAEVSFHVIDPLKFVRMSSDTALSVRHIVHGQMVSFLETQSLDSLQRYASGVQTELRLRCCRHLDQFGVVVNTFQMSNVDVIKQPVDHGQEMIKTVLDAIGNGQGGQASSSSSGSGSGGINFQQVMSNMLNIPSPPTTNAIPNVATVVNEKETGQVVVPMKAEGSFDEKITRFLTEQTQSMSMEQRQKFSPQSMFKLQILDSNLSWLVKPFEAIVEKYENHTGNEDQLAGCLKISDWNTVVGLSSGSLSPMSAAMSGTLQVVGDVETLARLFDFSAFSL